jgi:hypothetical protein
LRCSTPRRAALCALPDQAMQNSIDLNQSTFDKEQNEPNIKDISESFDPFQSAQMCNIPTKRMTRRQAQRVFSQVFGIEQSFTQEEEINEVERNNSQYLLQTGLQLYLEDLIQRLEKEKPKDPGQFLGNYFMSILQDTNIEGRKFEYINSTLLNRLSFLNIIENAYTDVDPSIGNDGNKRLHIIFLIF